MRHAPAIGFLAVVGVLGASLLRTGANLNLPAPVAGDMTPAAEAEVGSEIGRAAAAGGRDVSPPSLPRRRLLLVVVDGLRAELARQLPFLDRLSREGAHARLWADPPTYSTAQYVALLSGVPPRDSGVRMNDTIRPTGLDDLARRVRAAGRDTAALSTGVSWWGQLFPGSFRRVEVVPGERMPVEAATLAGAGFVLVHLCDVDDAGHAFGARTPEYEGAARAADATVAELARAWGWPDATLAIVSDHGHRERGGHGGEEADVRETFLILAGPGARVGAAVADARSVDVAPTLAALMGLEAPAQASGRTLTELLDAPAGALTELRASDTRRIGRVAEAVSTARLGLERAERRARILRGLPALALVGLAAVAIRRRPGAFARGVAGLLVAIAIFWLVFGPVSFSAARRAPLWVAAVAALTFAGALVGLRVGRRGRGGDALAAAALVAGFSPLAVLAFVHSGLFGPRLTCEPAWVAAGPAFAYAGLAGACLAAALDTFYYRARIGR